MTDPREVLTVALADRYRVERELGAGGMATVYLAHDLKHDRDVAIKVLHPELGAVLGAERFLSEIRTTANLQHPNILPLFDSGAVGGLVFYVMPYVEGETLRGRLAREGQLSVSDAVKLAQGVASALDYAHRRGVIHRDIKPENILLQDGQALVADFGIALAVSNAGGARITQTGISVGTPQYMSPEQAAAERQLDGRSDQYSLAAVLYEMLAGEPPFSGPSAPAILTKLMTEQVPPLTTRRPSVPLGLADAVHRALEKVPADRFATAADFAEALTRERTGMHRTATPMAVRDALRSRVVQVLAAVAAVAIVAAGVGWTRARGAGTDRRVMRFPVEFTDPIRMRNRSDPAVSISSDGSRLMYYANGGHRVMDLASGESRPVSTEKTGISASFSPTGDSVVLRSSSWLGQLHVVDLATHRATLLADSAVNWMRWQRDGWIYYRDLKSGIRRVRAADGRQERLVTRSAEDSSYAENAEPVRGGDAIIYTRRQQVSDDVSQAEIVVFDRRRGTTTTLVRGVSARLTPSGHLLFAQSDGSLLAARFNERTLSLVGSPVKVLDGLLITTGFYAQAAFDFADDGSLVYVHDAPFTPDTLFVVGRDGRLSEPLASWGGWISASDIALSQDGERWAAAQHIGQHTVAVWVRDASRPQPRRLTFGWTLDYYPRFVSGDREIAFVSPRGGRNWDLYSVPFDGNAEPTLLLDREGDIAQPRFSASGRWVVFCERGNLGQEDIVAHRFGPDSETVRLVASPANESYPDISRDERWLAYQSSESGRNEVFVRRFNAPGAPLQVSTAGGRLPRWSFSGRELIYVNDLGQVVAIPITTTGSFTYGSPRVLFTPDARTIWLGELTSKDELIVNRRILEAPGQVIVIRNFTQLLREKVGR